MHIYIYIYIYIYPIEKKSKLEKLYDKVCLQFFSNRSFCV